jgi:hypothetical protein
MSLFADNKDGLIALNKYVLEVVKFDSYSIYVLEIK